MKKFHVWVKCEAKEPHEACLPVRADDADAALKSKALAADGRFDGVCHVLGCDAKTSLRAEPAPTLAEQLAAAGVVDGVVTKQHASPEDIASPVVDVTHNDLTAALADAAARGLDEYGEPKA